MAAETISKQPEASMASAEHQALRGALLIGALGVVFGDIGTSPIYTLRESAKAAGALGTQAAVLGVLSLLIWAVLIVVTFKYVLLVMRADDQGEGGIAVLLSAALRGLAQTRGYGALLLLGVIGIALFFGNGMITPALSVLSAIEGLQVATPVFGPYVIPITLAILVALFVVQRRGSERLGTYFGPIMVAWFATLALAGAAQVVHRPSVLAAVDPRHALGFIAADPGRAFVTLGSVFLAVTGGEALYADMGHFGRRPIRVDWFAFVLPALVLNYAGQAALVLADPAAADNPFFKLVPGWGLIPLVVLSAAATVIASQAVISGTFSLTQQCIQLGLMPRLDIRQTSEEAQGQIYVPQANWMLMVAVIALVLAFRTSSNLAAAYGIAVTGTMLVTTVLLAVVMRREWGWNPALIALVAGPLLVVDLVFFTANVLKILQGGWVPVVVSAAVLAVMLTWRKGRRLVLERVGEENTALLPTLRKLAEGKLARVPGTAIYLTANAERVPSAMAENLKHNQVLHDQAVLLTVETARQPRVPEAARGARTELAPHLARVVLRFGFAEKPDVPCALRQHPELGVDVARASFFTGRELPVPAFEPAIPRWQEQVFAFLTRNAVSASDYFVIPAERVVELGTRVEI